MRSSARGARLELPLFACVFLALAWTLACGGQDAPEPRKVEKQNPFDRGAHKQRDPQNPLRNPEYEAPTAREGKQLAPEELEATLAEAAEHLEAGNVPRQRAALRKCANKIPASARCDGQLGLSMIGVKSRRATALYYLMEAARTDDPKADAALYAQIGEELRRHGKFDEAIAALELAVARDNSAENLFALGRVLSLKPSRLRDAANRMAEARALDDRPEWHYEEAVIRGQIPAREEAEAAATLFQGYLERLPDIPQGQRAAQAQQIEARIAELRGLVKVYPPVAEWEAQLANDPAKGPPGEDADPDGSDGAEAKGDSSAEAKDKATSNAERKAPAKPAGKPSGPS